MEKNKGAVNNLNNKLCKIVIPRTFACHYEEANLPDVLARKKRICNMLAGTAFCKIPGTYGNKWPTQEELHQKLFDKKYHTATVSEVEITARCFWGLEKKQVFSK